MRRNNVTDNSNDNGDNNDERVGYRNPPKKTRFKKGQSGNPGGRPKGSKPFLTIFGDAMKRQVHMKKGGKTKTVTTKEALIETLVAKALSGDIKALFRLIDLAGDHEAWVAMKEQSGTLSDADIEILESEAEFVERVRNAREATKAEKEKKDE